MPISREELYAAAVDRVTLLPGITVYQGEVPAQPPVTLDSGGEPDPAGRVAPYAVLYGSAGAPTAGGASLNDCGDHLDWTLPVTVAAGYQRDLLDAIDLVHNQLYRWHPTGLTGFVTDGFRPVPGFNPSTRRDDDVDPPRHFLPLLYRLIATT
ncbi:hypothetical protein [Nocardioides speluncae]|uniref:hypothetical protein n=1 Tax=Nocardioides speluncae TaxID=2670337 RepID=UPI0012B16E73|nr:hypothetical protein [Nocardioides speluncae]